MPTIYHNPLPPLIVHNLPKSHQHLPVAIMPAPTDIASMFHPLQDYGILTLRLSGKHECGSAALRWFGNAAVAIWYARLSFLKPFMPPFFLYHTHATEDPQRHMPPHDSDIAIQIYYKYVLFWQFIIPASISTYIYSVFLSISSIGVCWRISLTICRNCSQHLQELAFHAW